MICWRALPGQEYPGAGAHSEEPCPPGHAGVFATFARDVAHLERCVMRPAIRSLTCLLNECALARAPFFGRAYYLAMSDREQEDLTTLLHRWTSGDGVALDELVAGVYPDLRAMASRFLSGLRRVDSRKAELIELCAFLGCSRAEAADLLGVSVPTVKRDFRLARAS